MRLIWRRVGGKYIATIYGTTGRKQRDYVIKRVRGSWDADLSYKYQERKLDRRTRKYVKVMVHGSRTLGWLPTLELAKKHAQDIEDYVDKRGLLPAIKGR